MASGVLGLALACARPAMAVGHWAALANTAPDSVELMLLLSDGTVMAANNPSDIADGIGNKWYRLTPDNHGSYINGTWAMRAAANSSRLFYSSAVLTNGNVLVAGGEYGNGGARAEVYNPGTDAWTPAPVPTSLLDPSTNSPILSGTVSQAFLDSQSRILANGKVMVTPVASKSWGSTLLYDPAANSWAAGPTLANAAYQDEASWVKLPDGSILTINPFGTNTERYIPALNQWVSDAPVTDSSGNPLMLYDSVNGEIGPALLLPDGRAFFLGGSGLTAFYTPSGNNRPGQWAQGPNIPNGLTAQDAPAAMMMNGKILCAFGSPGLTRGSYPSTTWFFEYDPVANSFTAVNGPTGPTDSPAPYLTTMLDLPDGTVLYSHVEQGNAFYSQFGSQLYVYIPDGAPVASGKPTITGISLNNDGSYHLTGLGLNGISEGAAYGDDAQMNSNYPLVRLTDGSGDVSYAFTYGWTSTGVMTGNAPVSTEFRLPAFFAAGSYQLSVVANGISSDPITFNGPIYVDFNYSGFQLGIAPLPFSTMAQGVASVPVGGEIVLEGAGSSSETMTISKPMTITAINGPSTIGH